MSVTTASTPYSPMSPGVAARRKVPKVPRLPLSAFTPPNSGTSEKFPLPPSPSSVHPEAIVDAAVLTLDEQSGELGKKTVGVVLRLDTAESDAITRALKESRVIAVTVPFPLENGAPDDLPSFITSPTSDKIVALRSSFARFSPAHADGLHWALARGFVVELEVQPELLATEEGWEALNEFLGHALGPERPPVKGTLVLCNVLPAPLDLTLPLVKLLTHSTYRIFQNYMTTISLLSTVSVKFTPPAWGAPTPSGSDADAKDRKEWKRRIKMYIGHAVEAFGQQRLMFGSAPALTAGSSAGDWYELARECVAELGVEQEAVDAVFGGNAKVVYAARSSA